MTRHKSRVARRSRRSARRGTRKQSGGFSLSSLNPLNWFKKTDSATAPAVAEPAASPVAAQQSASPAAVNSTADDKSWLKKINIFGSSSDDKAPAQIPAPANDTAVHEPQGGGRKKSRKTRHRRRSPRHHRK